MKRFFLSVGLCFCLLGLLSFVLARSARAKEDVIQSLLDLPAPPPPNPLSPPTAGARPEKFYDKTNPPADDAPIGDLLDYWKYQSDRVNQFGYSPKPSEKVIERLIGEIDKDPKIIGEYVNLLGDSKRGVEFAKHVYDQMPEEEDEGEDAAGEGGGFGRGALRAWLTSNSSYFSDGLARQADQLHDTDGYVTNHRELVSLTRVDWERARPIVDRAYSDASQPIGQTAARWALYKHAMQEDSIGDIDRYRQELMDTVANGSLPAGQRDLALDALLTEREWSGRDDWYFSLFNDETLLDLGGYTGLTTMMLWAPDDRYIPRMIELLKSDNANVRTAAARNLTLAIAADKPEVVEALLPWLQDPKWAKDVQGARIKVVQALQTAKLPESVPGLLAALDEKEVNKVPDDGVATNANAMANMSLRDYEAAKRAQAAAARGASLSSNSNGMKFREVTTYPLRSAAIDALGNQGDPRAVPLLKRVFNQVEEYERQSVVAAILKCNGFSANEQANALEGYVRELVEQKKFIEYQRRAAPPGSAYSNANGAVLRGGLSYFDPEDSYPRNPGDTVNGAGDYGGYRTDLNYLLGSAVATSRDVSEELAVTVIRRIGVLEKTDPETADALRSIITNWRGKAMNLFLLDDLKSGKAGSEAVVQLLTRRKELREKQPGDVSDIRNGTPTAAGIAACLLESEGDYAAVLSGGSDEARKALFACARLIRAKLPLKAVAVRLQSADAQLALAAERYLESEDSPEARRSVLSKHSGEAKILGATTSFRARSEETALQSTMRDLFTSVVPGFAPTAEYFYYPFTYNEFDTEEKSLQKEVIATPELLGIYAYDDSYVRMYKDKAVYSRGEDASRYRERTLEKEEFENLKNYLARNSVDELPPFLSCEAECEAKELVMLSKAGGRRVFVRSTKTPEFFAGLEQILEEMGRRPAKLRYWLEKDVPGLEIVFANERYAAETVWKNGADLRILVADKVREKEIAREMRKRERENLPPENPHPAWDEYEFAKRQFEHYSWHHVAAGELGESAAQPPAVPFIPTADNIEPPARSEGWKAMTAATELRVSTAGLYKVSGGRAVTIANGFFATPVVSANGRWAVVTKYAPNDGPPKLMRVSLLTNRITPIAAEGAESLIPIAYVASVNRFLVAIRNGEDEPVDATSDGDGDGTYFWITPETGRIDPILSGELRPLAQQRYRPLQPTATPFEYWAAIPDIESGQTLFGTYSTRTFSIKPLMKLPRIQFNSQAMWVDEAASRVYFVYEGHVLSVPFRR